jgi:hypothetical protein
MYVRIDQTITQKISRTTKKATQTTPHHQGKKGKEKKTRRQNVLAHRLPSFSLSISSHLFYPVLLYLFPVPCPPSALLVLFFSSVLVRFSELIPPYIDVECWWTRWYWYWYWYSYCHCTDTDLFFFFYFFSLLCECEYSSTLHSTTSVSIYLPVFFRTGWVVGSLYVWASLLCSVHTNLLCS